MFATSEECNWWVTAEVHPEPRFFPRLIHASGSKRPWWNKPREVYWHRRYICSIYFSDWIGARTNWGRRDARHIGRETTRVTLIDFSEFRHHLILAGDFGPNNERGDKIVGKYRVGGPDLSMLYPFYGGKAEDRLEQPTTNEARLTLYRNLAFLYIWKSVFWEE